MSRLARTLTAAMVADVQRVTGFAGKSGDLAAVLAPYAAMCEGWQKESRKMRRLTKAVARLIECEQQTARARHPSAVADANMRASFTQQTLAETAAGWAQVMIPHANGHDLGREVRGNGQGIPPWHPEARE